MISLISSISFQQLLNNSYRIELQRFTQQVKVRRSENSVGQRKEKRRGDKASAVLHHPRPSCPLDGCSFTHGMVYGVSRGILYCVSCTLLPLAEAARDHCIRDICPVPTFLKKIERFLKKKAVEDFFQ